MSCAIVIPHNGKRYSVRLDANLDAIRVSVWTDSAATSLGGYWRKVSDSVLARALADAARDFAARTTSERENGKENTPATPQDS